MRKLIASVFVLSACATPRLKEPERSGLYVICLQGGITVTACECIEAKTVKETSKSQLNSPEEGQAFLEEAKKYIAECEEQAKAAFRPEE